MTTREHSIRMLRTRFCSTCKRAVKIKKWENPVQYTMSTNKYCDRECFNKRLKNKEEANDQL